SLRFTQGFFYWRHMTGRHVGREQSKQGGTAGDLCILVPVYLFALAATLSASDTQGRGFFLFLPSHVLLLFWVTTLPLPSHKDSSENAVVARWEQRIFGQKQRKNHGATIQTYLG
ncbi:MAG: hypothetical protein KDE31_03105, partial [Caldilineaceae bacterium]|nr:hypothetical protein [Caldilineaceae bacterium]